MKNNLTHLFSRVGWMECLIYIWMHFILNEFIYIVLITIIVIGYINVFKVVHKYMTYGIPFNENNTIFSLDMSK